MEYKLLRPVSFYTRDHSLYANLVTHTLLTCSQKNNRIRKNNFTWLRYKQIEQEKTRKTKKKGPFLQRLAYR